MTQREKRLATGLVGVLGVAACAAGLYFFAVEPLSQASARAADAEQQLRDEEGKLASKTEEIKGVQRVDPRMKLWDWMSLPPTPKPKAGTKLTDEAKQAHLRGVQVDYEKYLHEMMRSNYFKPDTISVQLAQVDRQVLGKGKEPPYEKVAFRVSGRGDLSSVTRFMEEFHKAPLLHQLRNMTVEMPSGRSGAKGGTEGELEMKATVEALQVAGAKERVGLLPDLGVALAELEKVSPMEKERRGIKDVYDLRILASTSRNYDALSKKNIFTGIKPPPPPKKEEKERPNPTPVGPPPKPKKEDPADVLAFMKLTMLCYDSDNGRWYATVYDQAKGGSERRLSKALDELVVYDRYDQVALDAKVVHVDGKQLVFKAAPEKNAEKKYYRVRIGEFVYPTYPKQPMSRAELNELGIVAK